jgi:hypothetical protein
MLAYWRVRSAFNPRDALPAGLIRGFETALQLRFVPQLFELESGAALSGLEERCA